MRAIAYFLCRKDSNEIANSMQIVDKSNIITNQSLYYYQSKSILLPAKSNAITNKSQCNCQLNSMLLGGNNDAIRKRIGWKSLTKNNKFRAKPFENKKIKRIFVVLRIY